jgi:hypothetical protein
MDQSGDPLASKMFVCSFQLTCFVISCRNRYGSSSVWDCNVWASRFVSYESAVTAVYGGCCDEGKKTCLWRLKAGVPSRGLIAALRSKMTGSVVELAA